jgi:threonine synthase
MLAAQWRGYGELKQAGVVDRLPRMFGVQSLSAPPLIRAFEAGEDRVSVLPYAGSKISGINVPFTGEHALSAVRESGGAAAGVRDEEAFAMQARIGREEGLWVEPASAAPVAALSELLKRGLIQPGQRVVCIFSGAGFKDSHLAEAESIETGRREPLPFEVEAIVEEASL